VGFDAHAPIGLSGARAALPIWTDFMMQATAALPPREFPHPPGVTLVAVDRESGKPVAPGQSTASAAEVIVEAFRDLDAPPEPEVPDPADVPPWPVAPGDDKAESEITERVADVAVVGEDTR
jgi:penicillin-binding protein 1A